MPEDSPAEPILTLRGELVGLGPASRDIVPHWTRWMNDLDVTRTLAVLAGGPLTREDEEAWYDRMRGNQAEVLFVIYELSTSRPIGTAGLHGVNHRHGTATFGIMIGEKECWGRGYGTEATRLTLDYAFSVLGLHNVLLTVYEYNRRGIRAYEKAGFRPIGRRTGARRIGDRRYDELYMEALAPDFADSALRRSLVPGD